MILTIIVFWVTLFVGFGIGYLVPEKLVVPFGLFDVYPWKCRKCMTHWTLTALYASVAIIIGSWVFFVVGEIVTIAQSYCFHYTDKERGL